MTVPTRFEDEFPKAAEFLQKIYSEPPQFVDEKGVKHWLPFHFHNGEPTKEYQRIAQ